MPLVLLTCVQIGHPERLAIWKHDLKNTPGRIAVLDGLDRDGYFVPRLEAAHAPAPLDHVGQIVCLGHPIYDGAFVVLERRT